MTEGGGLLNRLLHHAQARIVASTVFMRAMNWRRANPRTVRSAGLAASGCVMRSACLKVLGPGHRSMTAFHGVERFNFDGMIDLVRPMPVSVPTSLIVSAGFSKELVGGAWRRTFRR